jgi:hypothetical protein
MAPVMEGSEFLKFLITDGFDKQEITALYAVLNARHPNHDLEIFVVGCE